MGASVGNTGHWLDEICFVTTLGISSFISRARHQTPHTLTRENRLYYCTQQTDWTLQNVPSKVRTFKRTVWWKWLGWELVLMFKSTKFNRLRNILLHALTIVVVSMVVNVWCSGIMGNVKVWCMWRKYTATVGSRVELVWAGFSSWQVRDREQVLSSSTGGVSLVTPPVESGSSTQIHHQHLLSTQWSVVKRTPNLPSEPAIPGWLLTSECW